MRANTNPNVSYRTWLARADRARRIAATLSADDAKIVEVYARECESQAVRLIERRMPQPLAA